MKTAGLAAVLLLAAARPASQTCVDAIEWSGPAELVEALAVEAPVAEAAAPSSECRALSVSVEREGSSLIVRARDGRRARVADLESARAVASVWSRVPSVPLPKPAPEAIPAAAASSRSADAPFAPSTELTGRSELSWLSDGGIALGGSVDLDLATAFRVRLGVRGRGASTVVPSDDVHRQSAELLIFARRPFAWGRALALVPEVGLGGAFLQTRRVSEAPACVRSGDCPQRRWVDDRQSESAAGLRVSGGATLSFAFGPRWSGALLASAELLPLQSALAPPSWTEGLPAAEVAAARLPAWPLVAGRVGLGLTWRPG